MIPDIVAWVGSEVVPFLLRICSRIFLKQSRHLYVFSCFSGIIKEPAELQGKCYPLKFKFVSGPGANSEAPRGSELGFMDARIKQYKFEFNMSSIIHMTSFIEDEKITTPTPMHVSVSDLTVVLKVTQGE